MPTTLFSSPTATRAVNEKRRPPLTTLATRLISITRSCRSRPLGLTVSTAMGRLKVAESELQPALTGALGEGLDAAVIAIPAAVEDAGLDARIGRARGEHAARLLRLLHRVQPAQIALGPVDRGQGLARVVVDQLGEDAAVGAIDAQAGPLRAA